MYAAVAWVLISSGTQVQPQIILNPDYLPDYFSVSYDYENIKDKMKCVSIKFDIRKFYPYITKKVLTNVLPFAKYHGTLSADAIILVKHCHQSLLLNNNEVWKKKNT